MRSTTLAFVIIVISLINHQICLATQDEELEKTPLTKRSLCNIYSGCGRGNGGKRSLNNNRQQQEMHDEMMSWLQFDGEQSPRSRMRYSKDAVAAAEILGDLVEYLQSMRDHRQDKITVLVPRRVGGTNSPPVGIVSEDRKLRSNSNEANYLSPERYYMNLDKND